MKKLYEVIFVSEYNNFMHLGWFENLDDAVEKINEELSVYGNGKYKFEKGELIEYPSTFGNCFDVELAWFFSEKLQNEEVFDDLQSCEIRGFIWTFKDDEFSKAKELFINAKL
ncbi:MAG: hypothetical protein IKF82_01075 [Bacilli bacterium]|nr:hypothetical protein [Bacilli bacterium]